MVEIREFSPEYKNGVLNLVESIVKEMYDLNYFTFPADLDKILQFYSKPQGIFLIAVDKNKVVGMGGISHYSQGVCELKRLYVHKNYRARGIGEKIVEGLISFARENGYSKVILNSAKYMTTAIKLFEKFGFRGKKECEEASECFIMEKIL